MYALTDKVAIVAGASSGIGHATAKLFAREGAASWSGARRRAELDALVAEIEAEGGAATAARRRRPGRASPGLVETALARFGGLDIAFNNAGTLGEWAPRTDCRSQGGSDTIETNLTSAFLARSTS